MCLKMINFDAVEFSECRSKEVLSLLWRSVYLGSNVMEDYGASINFALNVRHAPYELYNHDSIWIFWEALCYSPAIASPPWCGRYVGVWFHWKYLPKCCVNRFGCIFKLQTCTWKCVYTSENNETIIHWLLTQNFVSTWFTLLPIWKVFLYLITANRARHQTTLQAVVAADSRQKTACHKKWSSRGHRRRRMLN